MATPIEVPAAELDALESVLKSMSIPDGGVTIDRIKPNTDYRGWTRLYRALYALRDAGRVVIDQRGYPVPFEYVSLPGGNR